MQFPFTAELTVEPYLSGVRVDSFLVKHFRNYSPFRMQRLVRARQVRMDGCSIDLQRRVFAGERVTVRLTEPPDKLIDPEPLPVEIIYEDPWILVVDKPAGQVTHPVGKFQTGTLCNALQFHLDRQTPLRGLLRPGIVHRLDRETSGVLVVTKEHLSHRRLSIQFQRGEVKKSYLALVEGNLQKEQGVIDSPIGRLGKVSSILMSTAADARNRKPARTDFKVLERFSDCTLLQAVPYTGRIHQIRVHLASIGHPVVGDEFYGPFGEIREPQRGLWKQIGSSFKTDYPGGWPGSRLCELPGIAASGGSLRSTLSTRRDRHSLHAGQIEFDHPITFQTLRFQAAMPPEMLRSNQTCPGLV